MRRGRLLIGVVGVVSAAAASIAADGTIVSAASFEVTNLDASGAGSLSQAVADANASPGLDQITFAAGLTGTIPVAGIDLTDSVNIIGPGAASLTVAGNGARSVVAITGAATVVISGLTITNGGGIDTNSGGVYMNNAGANVTVRESVIIANTGNYGGGASAYSGQLTIEDSRVVGNTAVSSGGGVATATSTVLHRVEIADNTAALSGGGVFLNSGTVAIDNATIANNSSPNGAAIYRFTAGATMTVNSSTIVDNTSAAGDAIAGNGGGPVNNTILWGNTPSDSPGGAATNSLVGVDPQLEPLAFNGGITRTRFPLPTSPAIDAGDPTITDPAALDQRGARRVARSVASAAEQVDIGAVEVTPRDDQYTIAEDTVLTVADPGVLLSDNRSFGAEVVQPPTNGQVTLSPTGGFEYTPNANFYGTDTFTYRLVGVDAPSYVTTATIDVTQVIDPFTLTDDSAAFVNDGTPATIDALANDSGELLTIASVTQGALGSVTTNGSVVTYTPDPGATGTDTFQYVATEGLDDQTATATITVTLTAPAVSTTTSTPTTSTPTSAPTTMTPTSTETVAPSTTRPGGVLPATGTSSSSMIALAAAALVVGAVLAAAATRRRTD